MRGYVTLPQWYCRLKHLDEVEAPKTAAHGDAAAIDRILGVPQARIEPEPRRPMIGDIVFRVEDDGALVLVAANYDSSG